VSSHKCALLLLLLLLLSNFFFVVAVPALAFFALPSSSSLSLIPYVACLLLEFYLQTGILEYIYIYFFSIFFSICLSFFSPSFGKCRFRALASFFLFFYFLCFLLLFAFFPPSSSNSLCYIFPLFLSRFIWFAPNR
jgi:hypothetical protein